MNVFGHKFRYVAKYDFRHVF